MTPETRARFDRHRARRDRIYVARWAYVRGTVPSQAVGVVLRLGKRWWYVTPGFPRDKSAWRVSHGDELGPAGHETSDVQGRRYQTKYEAALDVVNETGGRARISDYVLPSGQHVELGVRR